MREIKMAIRRLHRAASAGEVDVIPVLVRAGADVNATNKDGATPLHRAASAGEVDVIPVLVQAGADVNARGGNGGFTPLHLAAHNGNLEAISVLIQAGADVNVTDKYNYKPIRYLPHLEIGE